MPSVYQIPLASAKVAVAGAAIDTANSGFHGCVVTRTGAGDFKVVLDQAIGPDEIAVQLTVASTGSAAQADIFYCQVATLPSSGNAIPFTEIRVLTLAGNNGHKTDPATAFFIRVDRVIVGAPAV